MSDRESTTPTKFNQNQNKSPNKSSIIRNKTNSNAFLQITNSLTKDPKIMPTI